MRGSGLAEVTATGARSEIGKIGKSLGSLETEAPRLQQQTRRLVLIVAVFGGAVSALVVVLYGMLRGDGSTRCSPASRSACRMLPEEFPVVLTVFMAMGAWRISQRARADAPRRRRSRRWASATVLCTDKTGTLTENRMTIARLRCPLGERLAASARMRGRLPPRRRNPGVRRAGQRAASRSIPWRWRFTRWRRERGAAARRSPTWRSRAYRLRPGLVWP